MEQGQAEGGKVTVSVAMESSKLEVRSETKVRVYGVTAAKEIRGHPSHVTRKNKKSGTAS